MSDLLGLEQLPPEHRSGFVAVIGRPNVGKSTLLNRLLGQKIAITSPKPQTTRDQLLGILTEEDAQIMFLDTPGIHEPLHKLGEYMVNIAEETIADADVILWLVDVNVSPTAEDKAIAELLRGFTLRKKELGSIIVGANKLDLQDNYGLALDERIEEYMSLLEWVSVPSVDDADSTEPLSRCIPCPFSALKGQGIEELMAVLYRMLPLGPRYYPEDQVTDAQTRFIVSELVREKALMHLQQEVPHSLAVVVDEFVPRSDNMTYISAILYVERNSQKGIVLGQNGRMIKKIGQSARPEIEELVGTKVYLELWVKVWEKWRKREGMLRRLGYAAK